MYYIFTALQYVTARKGIDIKKIFKYTCIVLLVYSYLLTGAYTSTKQLAKLVLSKDGIASYKEGASGEALKLQIKASRNHTARGKTKLKIISDVVITEGNILALEECGYLQSRDNFSNVLSATHFFPKPRDPPLA